MALVKTRSGCLALICMCVCRNSTCLKDSMLTAQNCYSDEPVKLPNKLIKGEMSKLKLWSD